MAKQKMRIPKSVKIYIRREKARLRKAGLSPADEKKHFEDLYARVGALKHDN